MAFTVLIVDDSPAMRSFIKRVLDVSGFEMKACLVAGDGREALAVLEREHVDIVLTDINMPVMDGEQFVRHLAQTGAIRMMPVLIISTDRTDDRIEQMVALGAKGYITKPFQPEALRARLEEVMKVSNVAR
jgi:two-component system chemotaxis response regulator CheY